MCTYSMVSDWGMSKWPEPILPTPAPYVPSKTFTTTPIINHGPTRKEWEDFKELVLRAIEYDERTGQPDCVDPKKELWMKKMSEYYDEAYSAVDSNKG